MATSNPSIMALVDYLVARRCSLDIAPTGKARHCSAIFLEKNQSCFKTAISWGEPRRIWNETGEIEQHQ